MSNIFSCTVTVLFRVVSATATKAASSHPLHELLPTIGPSGRGGIYIHRIWVTSWRRCCCCGSRGRFCLWRPRPRGGPNMSSILLPFPLPMRCPVVQFNADPDQLDIVADGFAGCGQGILDSICQTIVKPFLFVKFRQTGAACQSVKMRMVLSH